MSPHLRRFTVALAVLVVVATWGQNSSQGQQPLAPWLRIPASSDSCLDSKTLGEDTARRLGRSPEDAARALGITLVAEVRHRAAPGGGWIGRIEILNGDGSSAGSRKLERGEEPCAATIDALAFITAMVLESGAPSRPAPPSAPQQVDPVPDERLPPPRRWAPGVEGSGLLGFGLLPDAAFGGEASILVALEAGPAAYVSASVWPGASASTQPDRGATVSLVLGGAGLCPARRRGERWLFAGCFGGELGRLRARGFGLDQAATRDRLAADLVLGGEVGRVLTGGLYLALGARLVVPIIRDQIGYAEASGMVHELFRMQPAALVGDLRVGFSRL
jgi:hypothetical protein